MKNTFLMCFFTLFVLNCFSQTTRSEILRKVSFIAVKGEKIERTDSVVLQINNRTGDYDAKIYIPYKKGMKVSVENAYIKDLSGNIIRKLRNKEIEDRSNISDISLYEDHFIKSFELKHNSYPYQIFYTIKTVINKFLIIENIDLSRTKEPVRDGLLIVESLREEPIRFFQKNVISPLIDTLLSTVRYTWSYNYKIPQKDEINTSPNVSNAPLIRVIPLDFRYGIEGKFNTWQNFGNWVYRLNEKKNDLLPSEKIRIDVLLKDATEEKDRARILYYYLQDNMRYINVNIDIGGLQTYPASYVCTNRYGDCKALSNYMKAALEYAGIKSYYTLINASSQINDVSDSFPYQAFNHVILTIPFAKDTIYMECTSKNTPFGYISTSIQGRRALLTDKEHSRLISIPKLSNDDVLCTRKIYININTSSVKLSAIERGDNYELLNYLTSDVDKNTVDKYIRRSILSGTYDLLDFKFLKDSRDSVKISMDAELKMQNLHKRYGNNILLSPFPIDLDTYESPENRTRSVQINYPLCYKDILEYDLTGINISKVPENTHIRSKYGEYSQHFELKDNKLIVHKSITIFAGRYPLEQYGDFYKFTTAINRHERNNYYLESI
ncbi:transglutaminase-like domain-containing protein [Dysgonomonas sp. BGC7]|uniref:transglutaminase-like domain-containing protein n=1 Tax=Dysgonomonas sp. BGC7 TaxID=1658008 RepID=UPI00067F9A2C|nr:transglutaminase-like domain-containing protein [Dysgonomonas sp. BGC7]MBD8388594.1 transglutaminase domain-containing protein [Dysgonomonas sp. BGC7]